MLPRYNLLRSSGLRVAARSPASVSGMAPLSDAAKAALKGFDRDPPMTDGPPADTP